MDLGKEGRCSLNVNMMMMMLCSYGQIQVHQIRSS